MLIFVVIDAPSARLLSNHHGMRDAVGWGHPPHQFKVICREQSARFLYVDFWRVQGWRGHEAFQEWLERTPIKFEAVPPDEIVIDGSMFDPHRHFGEWRERQHEWTAAKRERIARAVEEASRRRAAGRTYKDAYSSDGGRPFHVIVGAHSSASWAPVPG
jgi:hypothetical protein